MIIPTTSYATGRSIPEWHMMLKAQRGPSSIKWQLSCPFTAICGQSFTSSSLACKTCTKVRLILVRSESTMGLLITVPAMLNCHYHKLSSSASPFCSVELLGPYIYSNFSQVCRCYCNIPNLVYYHGGN